MFMPGYSGVFPSPLVIPNVARDALAPNVWVLADNLKQRGFPVARAELTIHLEDGRSYMTHFDLVNETPES